MKKKTLSALRVAEPTFNHIDQAIKKYNDDTKHLAKLSKNDFRRLSYELLAQSILQDIQLPAELNVSSDI